MPSTLRGTNRDPFDNTVNNQQARIWGFRIVLEGNGLRHAFRRGYFGDSDIAQGLGINDDSGLGDQPEEPEIRDYLEKRLREVEGGQPDCADLAARWNLNILGNALGLTEAEKQLIFFTVTVIQSPWLTDAMRFLPTQGNGSYALARTMSSILDLPVADIANALQPDGSLSELGFLEMDGSRMGRFSDLFDLPDGLVERLHAAPQDDVGHLVSGLFDDTPVTALLPDDFAHMQADYQLLKDYCASVCATQLRGVNILLHGESGVGKTELVRVLCDDLGLNLYETANGESFRRYSRQSRFQLYQLGQRLLRNQQGIAMLFDEVEDIFPANSVSFLLAGRGRSEAGKARINHVLENNPIPAFWLCNEMRQIDSATLRRFDLVIEIQRPGRAARRKIVDRYFDGVDLTTGCQAALADDQNLTPAALESAAGVVKSLVRSGHHDADTLTLQVIGHRQASLGLPRVRAGDSQLLPYAPDLVNVDTSLADIRAGLEHGFGARLCLYGPPGTGKTAWARHLADALNRPLIIKRVSDIESPYVGVCEKNIAAMFEKAETQQAILLLDEADSFLTDRNNHSPSRVGRG